MCKNRTKDKPECACKSIWDKFTIESSIIMFDDDVHRYTSPSSVDEDIGVALISAGVDADDVWRVKSVSHCISDRNSLKLIDWFERKPSFSYTSSATLAAIGACSPTRTNIDSNSMRFFWFDWVSCEPTYDPVFMRSHLFHSSYKLLDRFSKSKLPVRESARAAAAGDACKWNKTKTKLNHTNGNMEIEREREGKRKEVVQTEKVTERRRCRKREKNKIEKSLHLTRLLSAC